MKMRVIIVLMLVTVTTSAMERRFDDSSDGKQRADAKDILSEVSCRYLKIHGYLDRDLTLKRLCLKTIQCVDLFSKTSCSLAKSRNECAEASKISRKYCRFTCDTCSIVGCIKSVPLGMESGVIPDSSITASDAWSLAYPYCARLHRQPVNGEFGYWAPRTPMKVGHWVQVYLGLKEATITGVGTQGAPDREQWTTSYSLEYKGRSGSGYKKYKNGKVFSGNTDKDTVVKNALDPPIKAMYFRILPLSWKEKIVLRMELYGCYD